MFQEAHFIELILVTFFTQIFLLIAACILLCLCWKNIPARMLSISFILSVISSAACQILVRIKIYEHRPQAFERPDIMLEVFQVSGILFMGISGALILWFACGLGKNNYLKDRPVRQSSNFSILMFFIGLIAAIAAAVYSLNIDLTLEDEMSVSIMVSAMQLVISIMILVASTHAMWSLISNELKPRSIGLTIGLLFVPLFNLYWFYKIFGNWMDILKNNYEEDILGRMLRQAKSVYNSSIGLLLLMVVITIVGVVGTMTRTDFSVAILLLQIPFGLLGVWYGINWVQLMLGIKKMEAMNLDKNTNNTDLI